MASYGINNNQNVFVSQGRTTSRVLAPPGGQCSISIGMPTPKPKAMKEPEAKKEVDEVNQPVDQKEVEKKPKAQAEAEEPPAVDTNEKIDSEANPPTNTTTKTQPVPTEDAKECEEKKRIKAPAVHKKVHTSSRVLAPPGGKQSIQLW